MPNINILTIQEEKVAKTKLDILRDKLVLEINDADLEGEDYEIDSFIDHIATIYTAYKESRDRYQQIVDEAYNEESDK